MSLPGVLIPTVVSSLVSPSYDYGSIPPKGPATPNEADAPSEPLPHCRYSQHQVASFKLAAVQGPASEVGLLWGFLPVLERCL